MCTGDSAEVAPWIRISYVGLITLLIASVSILYTYIELINNKTDKNTVEIGAFIITLQVVIIVASIILRCGVNKKNPKYFIAWLVVIPTVYCIMFVKVAFLILAIVNEGFIAKYGAPLILLLLSALIAAALWIYTYRQYKIFRYGVDEEAESIS